MQMLPVFLNENLFYSLLFFSNFITQSDHYDLSFYTGIFDVIDKERR